MSVIDFFGQAKLALVHWVRDLAQEKTILKRLRLRDLGVHRGGNREVVLLSHRKPCITL